MFREATFQSDTKQRFSQIRFGTYGHGRQLALSRTCNTRRRNCFCSIAAAISEADDETDHQTSYPRSYCATEQHCTFRKVSQFRCFAIAE